MFDCMPDLPIEVWSLILGHLNKTDLRAFACVSKECRRLAQYAILAPSNEYLVSLNYDELLSTSGAEQYIHRLTERASALGLPDLQSVFHLNDGQSSHLDGITQDAEGRFIKGHNTVMEGERCLIWRREGEAHRDNDLPAVVYANGTQVWYLRGQLHRDGDRPAIIYDYGTQVWYQRGGRHRDGDRPALISADGTQEWYRSGQLHRDGDRPAVIRADGTQLWYQDGKWIPRVCQGWFSLAQYVRPSTHGGMEPNFRAPE